MKLLRIAASGFPLFKKEVVLTFYAQQRINEIHQRSLFPLYSNSKYYLNCANALIGINASGKTSVLKLILLALDILNNEPINHSETRNILGNAKDAILIMNFLSDNAELCQLETHITVCEKGIERIYSITSEKFWTKPVTSANTKKKLVDFSDVPPYTIRTNEEIFLSSDISIIIAYNKTHNQHTQIKSFLSLTNVNVLPISDEIPVNVIQFLDPTVEKLSFERNDQNTFIHLKFNGEKEIVLSDPAELNCFLSSGTIKGIVVFTLAIKTLRDGGYLVIDELENHFNKEIAVSLIRYFMDQSTNVYGGTLIFSTHYPEILDEFERNDCIFITKNREGITVSNLSDILKRNDIKKSDAYQSGFLDGTVPSYDVYNKLRKKLDLLYR